MTLLTEVHAVLPECLEILQVKTCPWGHLKTPENRRPNGSCKKCHNEWMNEYRARRSRLKKVLSAEPLAEAIYRQEKLFEEGRRGLAIHIAANLGTEDWQTVESQLWHVTQSGQMVLWSTVDRLSMGMGYHPSELYGFGWTEAA